MWVSGSRTKVNCKSADIPPTETVRHLFKKWMWDVGSQVVVVIFFSSEVSCYQKLAVVIFTWCCLPLFVFYLVSQHRSQSKSGTTDFAAEGKNNVYQLEPTSNSLPQSIMLDRLLQENHINRSVDELQQSNNSHMMSNDAADGPWKGWLCFDISWKVRHSLWRIYGISCKLAKATYQLANIN